MESPIRRLCAGLLACACMLLSAGVSVAADEPAGPQPLPKEVPRLARDVIVMLQGSSVTMNRYGCHELPAWTGGYDRMPPQANGQAFRAAFREKVQDTNANACAAAVVAMCRTYKLPLVDSGPAADAWLAANPKGRFIGHVYADWYHPNQFGAAILAQTIHEGIKRHWPELPLRPVNMPVLR